MIGAYTLTSKLQFVGLCYNVYPVYKKTLVELSLWNMVPLLLYVNNMFVMSLQHYETTPNTLCYMRAILSFLAIVSSMAVFDFAGFHSLTVEMIIIMFEIGIKEIVPVTSLMSSAEHTG